MSHDEVMRITEKLSNFLSNEIAAMTRDERIFTPRDMENAVYQGIRAAYEAGEIAMREQTARMAECVDPEGMVMTAILGDLPTNCRVKLADAIRALPLSGAEKSVPAAPEEKGGAR